MKTSLFPNISARETWKKEKKNYPISFVFVWIFETPKCAVKAIWNLIENYFIFIPIKPQAIFLKIWRLEKTF